MNAPRSAPLPAVWILLGMTGIYGFGFFQRVAVPGAIFDALQRDFAASAAAIAGLSAVYLYLYGGLQLVAGVLADRVGAAREVLLGGILLTAGSLLFPWAATMPWLYAARALVGIGASLLYISLLKVLADLFAPRRFALLVGVVIFLGYAGGLAGTYPFERLAAFCGWRRALLGAGLGCALTVAGTGLLLKRAGLLRAPPGVASSVMLGTVLRNRACWPNLAIAPLHFPVYFVVQSTIGIKLLRDVCGLASATAAGVTFLMMLTTMVAALAGGWVLRGCGYRHVPVIRGTIGCTTAGMLLLAGGLHLQRGPGWFLAAYLLLALASLGSSAGASLMKALNDPRAVGTALGLGNGIAYLGVALLANAAGMILDHYRGQALGVGDAWRYPVAAYQAIAWMCLACCGMALALSLLLREAPPERPS